MTIILNRHEKLKMLLDAFCNAGHLHYGDMSIECSDEDYTLAKSELKNPTREEVWVKVYEMGKPIFIIDNEDGESYLIDHDSLNHLNNIPINLIQDMLDDEGNADADTYDWVLEYIMFNDKIYG